jgi:hypothetical protein
LNSSEGDSDGLEMLHQTYDACSYTQGFCHDGDRREYTVTTMGLYNVEAFS